MSDGFMTYETYLRQQVDKGCYGVAIISAEIALDIANFIEKQRERIAEADRKTENSSEKPNNCEVKNYCDDCLYTDTCDSKEFFYACTSKATISKMERVDEPQEVCDRPQKDCENCWKELHCRAKDEPQTDCPWK